MTWKKSSVLILHSLFKLKTRVIYLVYNTQFKNHTIKLARYGQRFTTERLFKVTTNSESTTSNVAQQLKHRHNRNITAHNVTDDSLVVNKGEYSESGELTPLMLTLAA